jgi:hypothetical protein
MEPDQIDILAFTVFGDLQQIDETEEPDSRASSGVISGKPMFSMESISISPSSIRYREPTLMWGQVQIRTLQVISPLRTRSRRRLVNTMTKVYTSRAA